MDFNRIRLTIDQGVATITLNHPEVLNGLSIAMLEGFTEALDHLEYEAKGVRAILLTGEGRAFCSGANLQGSGSQAKKRETAAGLETLYHPIVRRLRLLDVPLVAAVNGVAAGAGMSFALSCDLILAAKSAYFLQAFRRIGLVPDVGSTWLLPRLIGRARAMELSLLGEKLPAETALQWGLINRVYEDADLMPQAMALAQDLASGRHGLWG